MQNSYENSWNNFFSHVYVEEKAEKYALTKQILSSFSFANIVTVKHYKEVFCKRGQNFYLQKKSQKLILAVNENKSIYEGSYMCPSFGNEHFYYTTHSMNCVYDCEYCYLQGMYTSGNIVIFVNIEDVFAEAIAMMQDQKLYLCISYDTDLLALEYFTGFVKKWVDFAGDNENILIEVRTKSANYNSLRTMTPNPNVILAWTLSPDEMIVEFEHKTPSLKNRLGCIKKAVQAGWNVRICFDPVIYIVGYEEIYSRFIEIVFASLDANALHSVNVGLFRVPADYFKKIEKVRPNSKIFAYPFTIKAGDVTYHENHSEMVLLFMHEQLRKFVPIDKIL